MSKFLDLEGLGYYTGLVKGRYDPQITLLRTFMAYVGYAEISEVEKQTDNPYRIRFTVTSYYSGSGVVTRTGFLAARSFPYNTEITTDNCDGDIGLDNSMSVTSTINDSRGDGLGAVVKPYIEIDGVRHYGVQQRYFYNDLV